MVSLKRNVSIHQIILSVYIESDYIIMSQIMCKNRVRAENFIGNKLTNTWQIKNDFLKDLPMTLF